MNRIGDGQVSFSAPILLLLLQVVLLFAPIRDGGRMGKGNYAAPTWIAAVATIPDPFDWDGLHCRRPRPLEDSSLSATTPFCTISI